MKETFTRYIWSDLSELNNSKMDKKYDICINSQSDNCDIKMTISVNMDELENIVKNCISIMGAKKVIQLAIDSE